MIATISTRAPTCCLIGILPARRGPDFVGDRAGLVGQPGRGLGERQRGPLGGVEERVLVPRGDGEQLLRADAGLGRAGGAGVDARAAAVDWLTRRCTSSSV